MLEIAGDRDLAPVAEVAARLDPPPERPEPPPKVPIPPRLAEDGGRYRQGPVKPKLWDGKRKRSRPPRLFAADKGLVEAYEERCKNAEVAYRAAKQDWRDNSQICDGSMCSAAIAIPPWMLLGTLPLWPRAERQGLAVKADLARPG